MMIHLELAILVKARVQISCEFELDLHTKRGIENIELVELPVRQVNGNTRHIRLNSSIVPRPSKSPTSWLRSKDSLKNKMIFYVVFGLIT